MKIPETKEENKLDLALPNKFTLSSPSLSLTFLIWWSGTDYQILPEHLRKRYVGLGGAMLAATTLSAFSGCYAAIYSFRSYWSIIGGLIPTLALWGVDRAVLAQSKPKDNRRAQYLITRILLSTIVSFVIAIPMTIQMFQGATITSLVIKKEQDQRKIEEKITFFNDKQIESQREYADRINQRQIQRYNYQGKENTNVLTDVDKLGKQEEQSQNVITSQIKRLQGQSDGISKEILRLKAGDPSQSELSFPEQFHNALTNVKTNKKDLLLHFLIFFVLAAIDLSPIIIKLLVLKRDSYDEIIEATEKKVKSKLDSDDPLDLYSKDTLDLYHAKDVNPSAIAISFKQLAENYPDAQLGIVEVAKGDKNELLLRANTIPVADKSLLKEKYFELYNSNLGKQEDLKALTENSSIINNLKTMLTTVLQPMIYVNYHNQGDNMPEASKYNLNNSKIGGFAGDEGTTIGTTLNDYSSNIGSSSEQNLAKAAAEIQQLLNQLQTQGYSQQVAQQQVAQDLVKKANNNPTAVGMLTEWGQSLGNTAANTTVSEAVKEVFKIALRLIG